jgi:hypothetical protein
MIRFVLLIACSLLIGCAGPTTITPDTDHPANPQAAEAPLPEPSNTLAVAASTQPTTLKVTYTCPMHPEVISDKPGNCPKCGMSLVVWGDQP